MGALQEYIYNLIASSGISFDSIFFEDLPRAEDGSVDFSESNFPLVVYNMVNFIQSSTNEVRQTIPLKIDIWYSPNMEFNIYDTVDQVNNKLSRASASLDNSDGSVSIADITKDVNYMNRIPDSNINIKRIQMKYNIRYIK